MYTHILPQLEKLAKQRVLCVGDVMLDRYVYGQVERISPEAPIPVLRVQREAIMLGGCGNTVREVVALDGSVVLVSVIGDDQTGRDLKQQVGTMPQITPYLVTDNTRSTTIKIRYVADNQQLLRTDHEDNKPVSAELEKLILDHVNEALPDCDIVVLSDYAKGVLTDRVVSETIKAATAAGKRVLVDPKGRNFSRYRGATLLTPNRKELAEATGMVVSTVSDVEKAARALIAANNLQGVLAKLSADGICLVLKDQELQHFHAMAREVFDVSGAGDTVVATMALALAGGLSPADSAALASIAGYLVVGKIGTAVITREELAQELVRDQNRESEKKFATWEQASEMAARWRKQGLKVGFTNGCFDLIHPGHIASIRQSRSNCDRLFIGLNSDASVKRLGKGDDRPIQNENARATVLAAMADVDGIVIFDQDTPLELIKTIRPDVLVKGSDYTVETVVGAKEVMSWGGKVVLAQLIEGHSTTAMIKRSRGNL